MEKSYLIIYQGSIEDVTNDLRNNSIERFMILNDNLLVIYVPIDFYENTLNEIISIAWWQRSVPMSSLIEVTNDIEQGVSVTDSSGTDYIYTRLK